MNGSFGEQSLFLQELLEADAVDEQSVREHGRALGLDLARHRAAIVIDAADYIMQSGSGEQKPAPAGVQQRAAMLLDRLARYFEGRGDTITGYLGRGLIVVLYAGGRGVPLHARDDHGPAPDAAGTPATLQAPHVEAKMSCSQLPAQLRAAFKASVSVGIGRCYGGVAGFPSSYREALFAMSIGRALGGRGLYSLDTVSLQAFVSSLHSGTKATLARVLLEPLQCDARLLETLRVFFEEDSCYSTAAIRLSVHRNTLAYRLDKIAWLTGLDPRKHGHSLLLGLALSFPQDGSAVPVGFAAEYGR